jgi:hypothetical protein
MVAPSKGLQVAYTVAKHGVIGLTKVNAVEKKARTGGISSAGLAR